jgi:transposase
MLNDVDGRRSRRTWSAEDKQRIVAEAVRPGASVAEIARRHGLNANLVFTWRRTMQPAAAGVAESSPGSVPARSDGLPSSVDGPGFVPIGVFSETEDNGPGVRIPGPALGAPATGRAGAARPAMDERPGVIEIDLADGTRLRVDAFVNERALRRVLTALKAV